MRVALLVTASLLATSAAAAPKGKAAKKEFQKGVTAYQRGDFAGASAALARSFKLEADTETLFAWAQSERQQNKCESAIDLYNKLLDTAMPAENKDAVRAKLEECRVIIAAKVPEKKLEPKKSEKKLEPKLEPKPEPKIEPKIEPKPEPRIERSPEPGASAVVEATPTRPVTVETRRPWYKDPIGDTLTIAGIVSLGVGGFYLYSGKQAEDKSQENEADFEEQQDKAESHGRLGVVFGVAGGVLIVSGIVRYMTRPTEESTMLTGWFTETSGGVAAVGRF